VKINISDGLTPEKMRGDLINELVARFEVPQADAEQVVDALFRRIRRELWDALFRRVKPVRVQDPETGELTGIAWVITEPDSLEIGKELC